MSAIAAVATGLGRRRQTASLCLRSEGLLRSLVRLTQDGRLGPYVTPQTFELAGESGGLASAQREYDDGARFFEHFTGLFTVSDLAGQQVLDLGCGYGGRTVYYAKQGRAKRVVGSEISAAMVERCADFAANVGVRNVQFDVGRGEQLPYPDSAFDVVISFDVMEHVADPVLVLREITRVLRPCGDAWLVFPSYLGARASHLDYLTQLPLLHRLFDPNAIIAVVNEFLATWPERYGVAPQPQARVGPLGRISLPTLNGMSRTEALALATRSGLEFADVRTAPLITENAPFPGARPATRLMRRWAAAGRLPELLVGHVALHLRHPG